MFLFGKNDSVVHPILLYELGFLASWLSHDIDYHDKDVDHGRCSPTSGPSALKRLGI